MNLFTESEFQLLHFNVYPVPAEVDLRDHFSALKNFDSLRAYEFPDRNMLIRYMIYMYDKNSPMKKKFTNLGERQRNCAWLAGYDNHDAIADIFDLSRPFIAPILIEFLKFQNDYKWSQIVSNEHTFYEYQEALFSDVINVRDDKNRMDAILAKSKLMEDSELIANRIGRLYKEVFEDDGLIEVVKRQKLTPEAIANV